MHELAQTGLQTGQGLCCGRAKSVRGWEARVRSKVPPFRCVQLSSATVIIISNLTVVRAVHMAGHLQNGCFYFMDPCTFCQVLPSAEGTGLVLRMHKFLVKLLVQLEKDKKYL